ncbi:MAG: TFIIH basal transcription factor complex helicase XPB subunit, partial [Marteilia pararefringens]
MIFLEAFSPVYSHAHDFLIAISEPVSRPIHIHQYKLTAYSLYAAVSIGLQTDDIIEYLSRLSKVQLPDGIIEFIRLCTLSYGKVKTVLRHGQYYAETDFPDVMKTLLNDKIIQKCKIDAKDLRERLKEDIETLKSELTSDYNRKNSEPDEKLSTNSQLKSEKSSADDIPDDIAEFYNNIEINEKLESRKNEIKSLSFELNQAFLEVFQKRCIELDYPLLAEYDFREDSTNPDIAMTLKSSTRLRPYQEKCLRKMFGNGRSRSGVVVLPCGAGKTLVGVTAACTVRKRCLVLCNSGVSVEQWRQQFRIWSTIKDSEILKFTSDSRDRPKKSTGICITTYPMITYGKKRA